MTDAGIWLDDRELTLLPVLQDKDSDDPRIEIEVWCMSEKVKPPKDPGSVASHCYRAEDVRSAMDRRVSIAPEELTGSVLREAGCMDRVCVLPEQFNERMSYLADVLVQSIRSTSVEDDRLRSTIGQLSVALSYMMNSASWRDGELHEFDEIELQSKLGRFVKSR